MGLTEADIRRVLWTFVQAGVAYAALAWSNAIPGAPLSWKALLVGGVAAGVSAVKNLLLPDTSTLK
ncbi:MAG: hypothetical protein ACRDIC_14025 [bacterium]